MIAYRQADRRLPFLWELPAQPAGRWHAEGEGPVQYLSDTPAGAWAEFLRHEEITDQADLEGVARAFWAVDVGEPDGRVPELPDDVCRGGKASYPACRAEAARLRSEGATGLDAPSAALADGAAAGWQVEVGVRKGPPANGRVVVLFGRRATLVGWQVVDRGRPPAGIGGAVRHLS